jgi:hypothetical protein
MVLRQEMEVHFPSNTLSNKDISHSGMLEPQLCKLHQLDTLLSEKPKCHDKFLMVQAYSGHFLFAASSVIGFA